MTEHSPATVPTGVAGETTPFETAWADVRDALLRGLTHALSNRVMAIANLAELTSGPAGAPDARAGEVLAAESRRLDTLLRQFRMLGATDSAQCEPVHLGELLPSVVALGARHPEAADLPCELTVAPATPLAWGDPVRLQRVTLVLIVAATRVARRIGVPLVRVLVWGDERAAVVSVSASRPEAIPPVDHAAAAVPPGAHDVLVDRRPGGAVRYDLRMATLTEARRRGA